MLQRIVTNLRLAKAITRYAGSITKLQGLTGKNTLAEIAAFSPEKGRRKEYRALLKALTDARGQLKAQKQPESTVPLNAARKEQLRVANTTEPVPEDQCKEVMALPYKGLTIYVFERFDCNKPYVYVMALPYKGLTIYVFERFDCNKPYVYQPVITTKDGKPLHQIFVRSKDPKISRDHFAKRAIDHYQATGSWPVKQGISLSK